jgi:hypothetical protein
MVRHAGLLSARIYACLLLCLDVICMHIYLHFCLHACSLEVTCIHAYDVPAESTPSNNIRRLQTHSYLLKEMPGKKIQK